MAQRFALALLAFAAPAALVASCLDTSLGVWLGVFAGATFPVSLIVLGAIRADRLGRLGLPLALLWILLAAGLGAVLALPQGGPDVAGLPLATAAMIFVLVPVPLLGLGILYAASFDRHGLREEDLDRMRQIRKTRFEDA